ncbi:uncharacterized protein LOC118749652 [Rhagoletis pomonella]|uniref:uncharacterized protein LOC118749652 n=1 Tax=Rhagoletis pomonella TaxID=28610 RepID=UPI00177F0155|nr:uncharacterized protein LOC118749652 [Rhagoletis pomonella]
MHGCDLAPEEPARPLEAPLSNSKPPNTPLPHNLPTGPTREREPTSSYWLPTPSAPCARTEYTGIHRTYTNFNKADWNGFAEVTESSFAALPTPTDVHAGERQFRKVVTAAADRFIPSGRIAEVRPNFPAEAAVLANERDHLRQVDPGDPRLRELNLEIRQLVNQHKRTKWEEHLKACNFTSGVSKLWSTVRSLSNPTKRDDRVEISFEGHASSDPKKCANYFSRQFTLHPSVDKAKRRDDGNPKPRLPTNSKFEG